MSPRVQKLALTAHVITSVGWFGAVAGFLALAVAGLSSRNAEMVRAAYLAMDVTGWFAIIPLSLAALLTGIVMSAGTTWGFFRHYWVLAKIVMTIPSVALLLLHMQPVQHMASVATTTTLSDGDLDGLRIQLVVYAGAALVVLLAATALSMYKPRGWTRYGWRSHHEQRAAP